MTNHHAGSATGIDLAALSTYDPDRDTPGMMEQRDTYKDGDYYKVEDVQAALARATPQHSVTEQADWPAGYAAWLRNTSKPPFDNDQRPPADAFKAGAEWALDRPLASTAATQPSDTDLLQALRNADRLLRAAGFTMTGTCSSKIVAAISAHAAATQPEQASIDTSELRELCLALRCAEFDSPYWHQVMGEMQAYINSRAALAIPASTAPTEREPVAEVDESDDGLFVEILHGDNGSPLKRGDKLYLSGSLPASTATPVDMILHCPACGKQHIDAPDTRKAPAFGPGMDVEPWTNPPHRSHLCHDCGHIWRPADVHTNGVKAITTKGKSDSAPASTAASEQQASVSERERFNEWWAKGGGRAKMECWYAWQAALSGRATIPSKADERVPSDDWIMDEYKRIVAYPERLSSGDYATAIKLVRAALTHRATTPDQVHVSVNYPDCQYVAPVLRVVRSDGRLDILVEGRATTATPYGYVVEARDGHKTFFEKRPTGFDQPKWKGLVKVVELHAAAPDIATTAADQQTERKTQQLGEGMARTGYILQDDTGSACIVHQGAVRWLSNAELWDVVHPAADQQGAAQAQAGELWRYKKRGGRYEMVGTAKAAGTLKDVLITNEFTVYRAIDGGALYVRIPADFNESMERIDRAAMAAPATGSKP